MEWRTARKIGGKLGLRSAPMVSLVLLVVIAGGFEAAATPVRYEFAGLVTGVSQTSPDTLPSAIVSNLSTFTGHFSYDDNALDTSPLDPQIGNYAGGALSISLLIDEVYGFLRTDGLLNNTLFIENDSLGHDPPGSGDFFEIAFGDQTQFLGPPTLFDPTLTTGDLLVLMIDSTESALDSDILKGMVLDLAAFADRRQVVVRGSSNTSGNEFQISGVLTALVLIPEPCTALLLGGGLAALVVLRRRQG